MVRGFTGLPAHLLAGTPNIRLSVVLKMLSHGRNVLSEVENCAEDHRKRTEWANQGPPMVAGDGLP
jgi:hypothetical protein